MFRENLSLGIHKAFGLRFIIFSSRLIEKLFVSYGEAVFPQRIRNYERTHGQRSEDYSCR
jgi:hypothetical protein